MKPFFAGLTLDENAQMGELYLDPSDNDCSLNHFNGSVALICLTKSSTCGNGKKPIVLKNAKFYNDDYYNS